MTKLSANPDCYGRFAQASALADYLELLALHGQALSKARLIDFIADNEWRIRSRENFTEAGRIEDEDEPIDAAGRILALLGERADTLGRLYPFEMDSTGRLRYKTRKNTTSYLLLLAITMAHAHKFDIGKAPEIFFPEVVAQVYQARGWNAYNFGGHAHDDTPFSEALAIAGSNLKLHVDPNAVPLSKSVKDHGVDCIAHYAWCGARQGRWLTITQVTCAVSNEWARKLLMDAQPLPWSRLLGEVCLPQVVLAVPHHIEPRHRSYLLSQSNGMRFILDRMSLVPFVPNLGARARDAIKALRLTPIEFP